MASQKIQKWNQSDTRFTFWSHPQCFQYILRKWPQTSQSPELSVGETKRCSHHDKLILEPEAKNKKSDLICWIYITVIMCRPNYCFLNHKI